MSATPQLLAAINAAYNHESLLEKAVAAAFGDFDLDAATPETITTFQNKRPRFEIVFKVGAAQYKGSGGSQYQTTLEIISGSPVPVKFITAYKGDLNIAIITDVTEADKAEHLQYRNLARFIGDTLTHRVNPLLQPNLNLHLVVPSGTALTFINSDGHWQTSLTFAVEYSLNPAAFDALATALTTN